jgi:hypothetical protein
MVMGGDAQFDDDELQLLHLRASDTYLLCTLITVCVCVCVCVCVDNRELMELTIMHYKMWLFKSSPHTFPKELK